MENLKKELLAYTDECNIFIDCCMADYTTFRCGGNAAMLVYPESMAELFSVLDCLRRRSVPFMVMGNGSNLLFGPKGYSGVIVKIGAGMDNIAVTGHVVQAESGILLSTLARKAADNKLTGLEFASGIPGSLGGAVYMNAGAYGGEMKDVIKSVASVNSYGMVKDRDVSQLDLSYRHSLFQDNDETVIGVKFILEDGLQKDIEEKMRDYSARRTAKQPLSLPSAGSFFKRPVPLADGTPVYAGALIEQAGLKGLSVGGAQVSPLHAGFIVNNGDATAQDVLDLMAVIRETVFAKTGILLEPEVKIIDGI